MPESANLPARAGEGASMISFFHRSGGERRRRTSGRGVLTAGGAPALAMLPDPIEQGALEADIVAESLRLQPLVLQDFLPLGQELLVEAGLFDELAGDRRLLSRRSHARNACEMRGSGAGVSMPAIFPNRYMRGSAGLARRASSSPAISRKVWPAALSGLLTTIGVPESPPSRISEISGT